jgi:hypothetical protein
MNDNFIGNPKFTKELLKVIKPRKLKWNAAVTSNIADMPELNEGGWLSKSFYRF